ncbi:MAG: hypothetical protein WCF60_16985, partial [Anaerobacillus sp.]
MNKETNVFWWKRKGRTDQICGVVLKEIETWRIEACLKTYETAYISSPISLYFCYNQTTNYN